MKKYILILSLILAVFMIGSVSAANVTSDNMPIEYKELQPIENEMEYHSYGAYEKYPMQNFGNETKIAEDQWESIIIIGDNCDTRQNAQIITHIYNRTVDGNATIKITGNQNFTGEIYFPFLKTPLNLTYGQIEYKITDLERGDYNFKFYYSGNEIYKNGSERISFTIPSTSTKMISENNVTMYYRDGTEFNVTLKDQWETLLVNKSVYFDINGIKYSRKTNENGSAFIKLNLNSGKYDIVTYYPGTSSTTGNYTHTNLEILPTITGKNITKIYKNKTQYYVKLTDNKGNLLSNQTVRFNINGVFYNRTSDENGIAKLNINLNEGEYIITAENLYDNCKISNNITVQPTIISEDLIKIYKNDSQFNVKAIKTNGSPLANINLTFNINGVFYNRTTDNNGNTKLNINLLPGTYIITTENPYDHSKRSNTIIVTPYLYTSDLTKYYKSSSEFYAKLVDSNYQPRAGEEITFIINNVEYKRITDKNGEANLTINLKPGEYEITTKNSEYEVKNMINVLTTIIDTHEDNVTINLDENETYDVLILDGDGNPFPNQTVRFTYAGKTFDVETDSDGIARFQATRINQNNPLKIIYNGYEIDKYTEYGIKFKKIPYTIVGEITDNFHYEIAPYNVR